MRPRIHPNASGALVGVLGILGGLLVWVWLGTRAYPPRVPPGGIEPAAVAGGEPPASEPMELEAPARAAAPLDPAPAPPAPAGQADPPLATLDLRVTVVDDRGAPVPFAPGWLRSAGQLDSVWTADDRGAAELRLVPGESVPVGLGAPSDPWPGGTRFSPKGQATAELTLVAPPTGAIEVRVVDASGAPVPEADVTTDDGLSGKSDWNGVCVFPCARAGARRVHAAAPGIGRGNHVWTLAPGARDSVVVALRAR